MITTADKKSYERRFSLIRTMDSGQLLTDAQATRLTIMDAAQGTFFTYQGNTYYIQEKNTYQET